MPIDPKGTSPQPTPQRQQLAEINMKCRHPKCDSVTAVQIPIPSQPGQRIYRCTKCSHQWGMNVGGHIDI